MGSRRGDRRGPGGWSLGPRWGRASRSLRSRCALMACSSSATPGVPSARWRGRARRRAPRALSRLTGGTLRTGRNRGAGPEAHRFARRAGGLPGDRVEGRVREGEAEERRPRGDRAAPRQSGSEARPRGRDGAALPRGIERSRRRRIRRRAERDATMAAPTCVLDALAPAVPRGDLQIVAGAIEGDLDPAPPHERLQGSVEELPSASADGARPDRRRGPRLRLLDAGGLRASRGAVRPSGPESRAG